MEKKTKMMMIAALVALFVLVVVLLACNSKSAKIKKLEKFTATVEQQYQGYSESDLEKYHEFYRHFYKGASQHLGKLRYAFSWWRL